MNPIIINQPKTQPFEVHAKANGHQYFGYAGRGAQNIGYSVGGGHQYVNLVDIRGQTVNFQVNADNYKEMCARYDAMHLLATDYLYFWIEEDTFGKITNWRLFKSTQDLQYLYPIYQSAYDFESLYQLIELLGSVKSVPLRMFGQSVLGHSQLMKAFVSIPASKRHHHSYPGGLLAHSLECAFITAQNLSVMQDMSSTEKEVTVIAALFHDIGKTQTIGQEQHTSIGRLLDHEQLTLFVLGEHLNQLNQYWSKGAETLQYLLTWTQKMGFCRYVGGNVIKLADHLSTSTSLRRMAFKGKPDYYSFSVLKIGQQSHYVNRLV